MDNTIDYEVAARQFMWDRPKPYAPKDGYPWFMTATWDIGRFLNGRYTLDQCNPVAADVILGLGREDSPHHETPLAFLNLVMAGDFRARVMVMKARGQV